MSSPASKTALFIIFLTVVIDLLGFGIVLPLLARYARHFEASGWTLGLLLASFSAMQFLFAPLWGRLSDRVGRRPVLLVGLLGSTLFYTLFGYATSLGSEGSLLGLGVLTWLFVGRIGAGIAGATIPTAQAYIADVTSDAERSKGMALIGAAFGIGFTFGPLLGAGFVGATTDDPAVLVSSEWSARLGITADQKQGLTLRLEAADKAAQQASHPLKKRARQELRAARDVELLALLTPEQRRQWKEISAPTPVPGYLAGVLSGMALLLAWWKLPEPEVSTSHRRQTSPFDTSHLRAAISRPFIPAVLLTMFLCTLAFAQFESTLNLLTDELGMTDRANYLVFAYVGFILCLSQGFFVRKLLPKFGEFVMSLWGSILMSIGLTLVGVSGAWGSIGLLYAVLPLSVVGFSCLTPSLQSLLSRRSTADDQGGILGVGQSALALARILGQFWGALLIEWDVTAPYFSAAAMMLIGILCVLGLRHAVPAPASAQA